MVLIVAEKPSVAGEIAKVVNATKKEKGYLIGNDYIVSWCVGHLVELAQPGKYNAAYEKWNLETLPIIPEKYLTEISSHAADQFTILKELMSRSEVTELVEATDAGREGELIFRLVYHKAGCKKPFKRLWISSMEEKSIKNGLSSMKNGAEYDTLYHAAVCRQRADWLVGMNLTRLYSIIYNTTLNCGRVQTPTINLIVKRQREIKNFIPETYYTLIANLGTFKAYTKVTDPTQAQEIVNRCTDKKALVVQVEKQEKKENPPLLYDLTTLQREANRVLGYSAQQTLDYLQKLYENKLVTYPRTDSQYITEDMETSTQTMIENLLDAKIYSTKILSDYDVINVNTRRLVNNKKVADHHAILPTVSVTQEKMILLPSGEKSVLLLILYKTLSAAYTPHIYTSTKVVLDIEGTNFIATGKEVQNIGYRFVEEQLKYLLKATEEKEKENIQENIILPSMAQGDTLHISDVKSEEKKTQPQKPYTEDTLLFAMETAGKNIEDQELRDAMKDSGLGTPATRAGIIENIIRTGFVERDKKKLLIPTEKAYTFIDVVTDKIKEPELTAEWEKQLAQVHRGEITGAVFMENITSFIRTFVNDTKTLYSQNPSPIIFKNNKESIGVCPICGKDVIEHQQAFSCSSGKNGCGFVIWKTIASKTITKEQARKLLMKQKTDLIKGFISKSSKPFDAYLILKEDKTITFDFPPRK